MLVDVRSPIALVGSGIGPKSRTRKARNRHSQLPVKEALVIKSGYTLDYRLAPKKR